MMITTIIAFCGLALGLIAFLLWDQARYARKQPTNEAALRELRERYMQDADSRWLDQLAEIRKLPEQKVRS